MNKLRSLLVGLVFAAAPTVMAQSVEPDPYWELWKDGYFLSGGSATLSSEQWANLTLAGGCDPRTFCYLSACDYKLGTLYCLASWKSCDGNKQSCTCRGDMNLGTHVRKREGGEVK